VFFFLVGGFFKNKPDLIIAILFGLTGKIGIAVSGL
jgi:hypothetical protein